MTERRNHLLLVALIGAALVAALLVIVPGSPVYKAPVLGLDLQGGFEVTLEAVPPPNRPLREGDLNRSLEIIRNRVDKLGVAEPEVRKQGTNQISAALPGVDNPDRVREIIGSTAKLELFDLQTALTGPSIDAQGLQAIPTDNLYDLLASAATQSLAAKSKGGSPYYLFKEEGKELVAGPLRTREALLQTDKARQAGVTADKVPKGYKLFKVPAQTVVITCGASAVVCPGVNELNPTHTSYYLFKFRDDPKLPLMERFPQMSGEDLRLQGTRQDFDTQNGQPIVLMSFTDSGADKFHDITRAEAQRGQNKYSLYGAGGDPENFNQNFAIVLDKEIRSFPSIDFRQYPDGWASGRVISE